MIITTIVALFFLVLLISLVCSQNFRFVNCATESLRIAGFQDFVLNADSQKRVVAVEQTRGQFSVSNQVISKRKDKTD